MADNVEVSAGSGTNIAADEVVDGTLGTVKVQFVKIMSGTLDATDKVPGDATDGLRVNTRGGGIVIAQTPTITAGAYSASDAVGGKLTFANAARVSGGKGVINSMIVVDDDNEKASLELWLYNQDFTPTADNSPFDPSDTDNENLVGVIPIYTSDYFSANDNAVGVVRGIGLEFQLVSTTSLYGQLKCVATPTYSATTDLTIKLGIEYLD